LSNQAERIFQDENNTPINQQNKKEIEQNKIYLCGYLGCSGSLGYDKLV
jgi:hypothetical protein